MAKSAPKKATKTPKTPLTKNQLISAITERVGDVTKAKVEDILNAQAKIAQDGIRQGSGFNVPGVARLAIRSTAARPARKGRNPATGAELTIAAKPAGKKVVAKVDSDLRQIVAP